MSSELAGFRIAERPVAVALCHDLFFLGLVLFEVASLWADAYGYQHCTASHELRLGGVPLDIVGALLAMVRVRSRLFPRRACGLTRQRAAPASVQWSGPVLSGPLPHPRRATGRAVPSFTPRGAGGQARACSSRPAARPTSPSARSPEISRCGLSKFPPSRPALAKSP